MNKTFQKLFFCFLLLSATTLTQAQFSGNGSGTPSDPYIITTPAQLNEVRNDMEVHYKLQNDIDLTDYLAPGGDGYKQWGDTGWKPIGHYNTMFDWADFTGSFNGAGYKIIGLWINRPDEMRIGLFGQTYYATIDSLGIEIAEAGIKGRATIGGLVGAMGDGDNINHCYVTGGDISRYGINHSATHAAGGLVGFMFRGNINRCYSTVNVYSDDGIVGGLVGYHSLGNISNCYATGNVTNSGSTVGGLVGRHAGIRINNCYAVGNISGAYAGGLVGERFNSAIITNSFFDTQTAGRMNAVGDGIETGITGITTEEMQTAATFEAWDFSDIWGIYEGSGYPYLKGFNNDILIVPEGGNKVYDGQPTSIAYHVISDNPDVDCTSAKTRLTGALARSTENPQNVGEYTLLRHTLHSPHYQISFKRGVTYTITQRTLTIEAIDDTITYGQTPVLAYRIMPGDLIDGDVLTGTLYVDNLEIGEHAITQGTLTAGENYFIIFIDGMLTVLDDEVDIEKMLANRQMLTAYPNPTRGELIINNEQVIINNIQVFDLNGKLVLQPTTNSFDISHLPNGTYMIKVNEEVIKIVKK